MEYRIEFESPFYLLQTKRKFFWFYYWETVEYSSDYNKIEEIYKNLLKNK